MTAKHLPNVITFVRLALIPVLAWSLARGDYRLALPVFAVAAFSDFADGWLARRLGVTSRLGATLDPVADKLNMLVATVLLAWQAQLPLWLAIAIVVRDVVIVGGVVLYRALIGSVEMAPTWLSKLNTLLEFALLLAVMAAAAGLVAPEPWQRLAFVVVGATVIASGVQYVWIGTRLALAARSERHGDDLMRRR